MNNYLEIRQQLTLEQSAIWQPIEVRKLVTDETEARQMLVTLVDLLGLEGEIYTANLHICRHEEGGECELIDLLYQNIQT
jgi:hypothetical protein